MSETIDQKYQGTLIPTFFNKNETQGIQTSLQAKVIQLWEMFFENDTALTPQKVGRKTWILIKFLLLVFFLITSLVALTFWLWGIGFRSGWELRHWLAVEKPERSQVIALFLKVLAWPFIYAINWADNFVKKYFGWEFKVEFPAVTSSEQQTDTTGGE
ncbi:MAG: hypothetical protein AAGD25_07045 [Cyanobacteria bacterium P01_F01_bin.150]